MCCLLDKYDSFWEMCCLKVQHKPTMKMEITFSSRMLTTKVHGLRVKNETVVNENM